MTVVSSSRFSFYVVTFFTLVRFVVLKQTFLFTYFVWMRADVFCLFFFSLTTVPPPMKFYYFRFFLVSFYIIAFCLFMFKLELVLPLHVDFCCNDQFFFPSIFRLTALIRMHVISFGFVCLFVVWVCQKKDLIFK